MEYTTKNFATELNCSVRTLEDWRSKRSMKLLPARYDGRKAIYTSEQIPIAKALLGRIAENLPMESLFGGQGGEGIANAHGQAAPMGDAQEKNFSQDTCGDSSGDNEKIADEIPQNSRATFDTPARAEDNHFGELILELPAVESLRAADSDDDSAGKTAPNKAPQRFSEKSAFDPEGFSAITQNAPEKIAPDVHADFVPQDSNEQGEIGGTYFNATGAEKNNAVVDELNHSADVDSEHVDDKSTALIIAQNKLPTRIEDVAKFALIGRDRLRAVYAEISALDKIGVVEEVRKQKLEEGQRIGELVLLAEARLGELLNQMPKATTNHKRQKLEIPSAGKFLNDESESVEIPSAKKQSGMKKPSKLEAAAELGFCKNQVSQFQKLADNPAAVQKAIADAKTRGEIVTRAFALNMIRQAEKKSQIIKAQADIVAQRSNSQNPAVLFVGNGINFVPDEPYKLLLTDPPYSTDVEDIKSFAESWLPNALRHVRRDGFAYVFIGAYSDELCAYLSIKPPENLLKSQVLVWTYKNTLGQAPKNYYIQNWQACLFYRGVDAPALNCPITNEQWAVQDINAPDGRLGNRYHSWQKPDEIAERFIRHSTQAGDIVFDPFACTGTFLLAAAKLGRKAYGFEINPDNAKIAFGRGCENGGDKKIMLANGAGGKEQ